MARGRFLSAARVARGASAVVALVAAVAATGCARTDATVYVAEGEGEVVFSNRLSEPVFLQGCAPFVFQRRLDGEWVDAGPPFVCVWEGIAVVVEPGASLVTPFEAPPDTGLYRLFYDVGGRCQPERPLDQAECEVRSFTYSNEFEVERELCEPEDPGCRHMPAAPNVLCDDGVHYGGPSGECTRDPSSGGCGYEFLRCP